jgi:hypothetical protein
VLLKRRSVNVFVIARIIIHFATHLGQQTTIFVGLGCEANKLGLFGGDLHRDISMAEGLNKVKEIVRWCELSRTIMGTEPTPSLSLGSSRKRLEQ